MLGLGRIACPTYESATLLLFRRTSVPVWCAAYTHMQSHCPSMEVPWFHIFRSRFLHICSATFLACLTLVHFDDQSCHLRFIWIAFVSFLFSKRYLWKGGFPNIGGSNLGRHIEFILSLLKDWTMRHLWGVQAFSTTDFHLIATFHPKKSDGAKINPFQKSVKLLWEIWKAMWIKSPLFWKSVKSVAPSWLGNLLWVYLWLPHSLP